MIVLGIILLILGWLLGISLLSTIGIVLLIVGIVLFVLASFGHGRRIY